MSLVTLPDELLLEITDNLAFLPRYRRRELLSLTKVCKRLDDFSTSLLHSELCVSIYDLAQVLEVYIKKPALAAKVKSLELFYEEKRAGKHGGVEIHDHAMTSYTSIIQRCEISPSSKLAWISDSVQRDHTAIFTLALIMLPNIHTLLLGTLADGIHNIDYVFAGQCDTPKLYLQEAFELLVPRLINLDLPKTQFTQTDLRVCTNLTHLTIALAAFISYEDHSEDSYMPDFQHAAMPPTLRRLTIGQPRLEQLFSLNILSNLIQSKEDKNLPELRILEIYVDARDPTEDNSLFHSLPSSAQDREAIRAAEQVLFRTITSLTSRLCTLGVQTTFHWSDQHSIFYPLTCLISESLYSADALRAVELRGLLDNLRPKAEAMGRRLMMQDVEAREERHRQRRERGEETDSDDTDEENGGMVCGIGFD